MMALLFRVATRVATFVCLGLLSACGGGGKGGGGGGTSLPAHARFAFVANQNSDSISQYIVDSASGELRPNGYIPTAQNSPQHLTIDPTGRYVYAVHDGASNGFVSQYRIGNDGRLAALSPATLATGVNPNSVVIDPSGRFAYVVSHASASISQYSVGSDGVLSPVGTPVATGTSPRYLAIDPNSRYAYLTNAGSGSVSSYSIGANGALTSLGAPTTVGASPIGIAVHPNGRSLYVTFNTATDAIAQFSIAANGSLTALNPASVPTAIDPVAIVIDPSGRYAYAVGEASDAIFQYRVESNGALTPLSPASLATDTWFEKLHVDPSGRYVYAITGGQQRVYQFAIGASGNLSALPAPYVRTRNGTSGIASSGGANPVRITPKAAYVTNAGDATVIGDTISQYHIGANGALTPMAQAQRGTGNGPRAIAITPNQRFAYVINGMTSNNVYQYEIAADGGLTAHPSAPVFSAATGFAREVAVDPSGRFAYIANIDGTISQYTVGTDGALSAMSPASVTSPSAGYSVTVDPTGRYVYVADFGGGVAQFRIGTTGALSDNGFLSLSGAKPVSVHVEPTGRFAYVVTAQDGLIRPYAIDASGALGSPGTPLGDAINPIAIHPNGRALYSTYDVDPNVFQLSVNTANGALSAMTPSSVMNVFGNFTVAVERSGRYAYVTNTAANTVSQFSIAPDGKLSAMSPASVPALNKPFAMVTTATVE